MLIPLDIFKETMHNKPIENKLEAWLSFLMFDDPGRIIELLENYPEFRRMYEEIYDMCRNIEGVMKMYSKELAELDRNTVQYMIEEQEKVIEERDKEIAELKKKLAELSSESGSNKK